MKIGLLAYHNIPNFGANLQCFSTYKYLLNNGHEPVFIDWRPSDLLNHYEKTISKKQIDAHFDNINTYLKMTNPCSTMEEVAKIIEAENIEAVIIGSDAVLQHHNFLSSITFPTKKIVSLAKITSDRKFPNAFWGSFDEFLSKKIPFALLSGSAQTTKINLIKGDEKVLLGKQISKFSYVSVRDTWTKKFVEYISDGKLSPKITPDPVFGFNFNFGDLIDKQTILKKFSLPENYCLVSFKDNYTVSKNWINELETKLIASNLVPVAFPFPSGLKFENDFSIKIDIPLSPIDWYHLIKYSKGYIGHNMHPIVTCLHNVVPFFCFDHYVYRKNVFFIDEKPSKIFHIVNRAGLNQNRTPYVRLVSKEIPVDNVINAITNFDYQKCRSFSELMVKEYDDNMSSILKSFQKYYD